MLCWRLTMQRRNGGERSWSHSQLNEWRLHHVRQKSQFPSFRSMKNRRNCIHLSSIFISSLTGKDSLKILREYSKFLFIFFILFWTSHTLLSSLCSQKLQRFFDLFRSHSCRIFFSFCLMFESYSVTWSLCDNCCSRLTFHPSLFSSFASLFVHFMDECWWW